MIRILKTSSLGLIGVLAAGALLVSTASAQDEARITSDGPVTLKGEETGLAQNAMTMFGQTVECPGSTYTGHKIASTPHELVPSGAREVTLTPQYAEKPEGCRSSFNWKVKIDMNGCDYRLRLGFTTGGVVGTYGTTLDMVCPIGKQISLTYASTEANYTAGKFFCVQHIPAQTALTGMHLTDTGSGDIGLGGSVEGVKVVQTAGEFFCPSSETFTGRFHLDLTIRGFSWEGKTTAVSLSDAI
jgi:hypothetical protein